MIEAMREGTPTIAWRRGSVPEVMDEGVTGFIVETIEEAVTAVHMSITLDRTAVRQRFEQRFTSTKMASNYVAEYERLSKPSPRMFPNHRPPEYGLSTPVGPLTAATNPSAGASLASIYRSVS
ncbi:hypothetical protein D3C71_1387450 [compost metagenome]